MDLLGNADALLAESALEAAAKIGFHAALVPQLQRQLGIQSPLQLRTLRLLEQYGPQATILADSVAPLLEHPSKDVAAGACAALASIGLTPGALRELASLIRHRDPAPRLRCVQVLGTLAARAAKAAGLVVLRLDDPVEVVRIEARTALLRIGFQPAAVDEISRMLNHSKVERRLEMLDILGRYGSAALPASSLVVDLLRHERPDVREAASHALKVIGMDDSCLRAIQALAHHPAHEMRSTALSLLEECSSGPETAALLLSLMADRDVGVRERAAAALSRHGILPSMLPGLRKLLRDERWEVRCLSLAMLERAGEHARPALRLIAERMEDARAEVARAAASAFRAVGYAPFCLPDIERLLAHRKQDKRLMALNVLQCAGAAAVDALPLVTRCLGDKDWVVRGAACETFIAIGFHDSCLPEVRRLIQHQDREFRLAVIRALGACGMTAAAASGFLSARQSDNDAEVGRAAQRALQAVKGL